MLQKIIDWLIRIFEIQPEKTKTIQEDKYKKRNFMTPTEVIFYNKIQELETEYKIVPQIT